MPDRPELPGNRAGGTAYTGVLAAYPVVVPGERRRWGRLGRTAPVERFGPTLRERCARLVGRTLSFPENPKPSSPIRGSILYAVRTESLSKVWNFKVLSDRISSR